MADRRPGHHDGYRQEAARVLEKVAQVELAIFGVEEARASLALDVEASCIGNDLGASQRFRDRLGERSEWCPKRKRQDQSKAHHVDLWGQETKVCANRDSSHCGRSQF